MTLTADQLRRRKIAWKAISYFYLDTELDNADYTEIARQFMKSKLDLEKLKEIDKYEVFPTLQLNLISVAGVWEGFDEKWLFSTCIKNHKKGNNRLFRIKINFVNKLFYSMRNHHWRITEKLMFASRN